MHTTQATQARQGLVALLHLNIFELLGFSHMCSCLGHLSQQEYARLACKVEFTARAQHIRVGQQQSIVYEKATNLVQEPLGIPGLPLGIPQTPTGVVQHPARGEHTLQAR